jgi:hypothetical protein
VEFFLDKYISLRDDIEFCFDLDLLFTIAVPLYTACFGIVGHCYN